MTTLYTIGYGGRHPRHFVTLLTQHSIALICDVRAEPRRAYRGIYTFNPEKSRGPLPRLLEYRQEQWAFAASAGPGGY